YKRARDFLEMIMPKYVDRLHLYDGKQPIFHKYKLDQEIARIYKREVKLKEGGSIVIDPTEALVAIDVNSGNFRTDSNAEVSAYKMNLNAAREIARQLRLRDLGGVIVNDFIDMRQEKHRRGVERALRDAMDRDRARTKIMRTSPFGLIEMTRQRIRPSLKRSVYDDCPCCSGRGIVKTAESMAIEVVRKLMMASRKNEITRVTVRVHEGVSAYLNNKKRREIMALEEVGDMVIQVLSIEGLFPEHLELDCRNAKGKQVKV
ncbi:MAG: ribonuclease E/G, partial [Planctomycetes bacterium]|nr:ribonuclease E/G [Planctomycetota bacterium]